MNAGQHFLVVAPFDPDNDTDRFDVEHPPDCPTVDIGTDEWPCVIWNCGVGFHLSEYGFTEYFLHADDEDSADIGQQRVSTGRHAIEVWHETHRGFEYVEYSSGVALGAV